MERIRLICRMCLQCNDLVNIFSESLRNSGLWGMINVHLGQDVSEDDDMPEFICLVCIKTICDFDSYCIRASENQDYLRKNFTVIQLSNSNGGPVSDNDNTEKRQYVRSQVELKKSPESDFELPKEPVNVEPQMEDMSLLDMAPICYDEEVIFPMDDIGADIDYVDENFELEKIPDTFEQLVSETIDEDEEPPVEAVVSSGENVNEIFHNYCTSETEPVDINGNIPDHMKPLMNNYPKILMKDGKMIVRSWRLHEILQKFYILKCDICPEDCVIKFEHKSINELFAHYKMFHGIQGYVVCCGKKFRKRPEITFHMLWHLQPSAFRCSICGKKVSVPTNLLSHMKCHEGEGEQTQIRCEECGIRTKSKHYLEIHKLKVHNACRNELLDGDINEPHPTYPGFPKSIIKNGKIAIRGERMTELINKFYTFTCDTCPESKTFPEFRDLLEHYKNVHSTQGYIMCCGSKFKIRTNLIYHMARHLDPDAFKCRFCGKIIEELRKLKDHIMTHRAEEGRFYFCRQCPKRYPTQGALEKHMIGHIPKDQRKKYPCKFCGKIFDYDSSLHNHVTATHCTENYVCHVCGKVFKNKFVFKAHTKIHDPSYNKMKRNVNSQNEKSPNRICPYCSREFPTKKAIVEHVEEEHDGLHKCPHCHYSNTKFELYLRHMNEKHLLERKFICSVCGAKFEYESKLNYHMNGHTREKIYRCQFCGKEYISMSGFCRHGRECHAEEYKQLKDHNKQMRMLKTEPLEEVEVDENAAAVETIEELDFSIFLTPDE